MNKLHTKLAWCLVFIFFNVAPIQAQIRYSKYNFSYDYDINALVKCLYRLQESGDSIKVYMKMSFDRSNKKYRNLFSGDQILLGYRITESYYSNSNVYTGMVEAKKLLVTTNESVVWFNVPKPETANAYLFVAFYQEENDGDIYVRDMPLRFFGTNLYSKFCVFDATGEVPVFDKYIMRRDSVVVKNSDQQANIFKLEYFKYNFFAALPPMATSNTIDGDVRLSPDSAQLCKTDSLIVLPKKGNYVIGTLNNNTRKLNLVVMDNRYPKVSKTKELVDATVYICSDDERKVMRNPQKQKTRLDDFWLTLGQDKEFARKMIKNYYKKIEWANTLFTCHKEGWKTDMGMVYIIFGTPDEVQRTDVKEVWKYKRRSNIPSLMFIFNKKVNPFGDYYYELENNVEYTNVWFNTVDLWRRGIMEN